ncbi:unnamed protein product [Phyllotreta striolata]|uniref:DUF4806 domain-containing protein n=1 Tax=Phyllotreta striolata TaxID=444603 RepID=A0A9P0E1S3_PHYSR|nr:unnamed protein product [Phyllotreta striolata]CAG9853921.1 unnamed protein product [Phyllotreta striolata]CAG9853975.1 unnamed protein product [Phyllotreta striolata]CAG9854215.1 unnamed protein product [Phyllotreta striolata]CAG9854276.1 unnamed protein product [Phyllotreta striolata]
MNKKYCVVEFDDGLQLIPRLWINSDNEAFWPNFKTTAKYNAAVKNSIKPGIDWQKCQILRILYSTDNYEYGLKKVKEAEDESDICTTDPEEEKKKRKYKATKKLSSSEDEMDTTIVQKRQIKHRETRYSLSDDEDEDTAYPTFPTDKTVNCTPAKDTRMEVPSQLTITFQEDCMKLLQNVQRKVVAVSLMQQEILDRLNSLELGVVEREKDLPNDDPCREIFESVFPVNTIEEMERINNMLKTNDNLRKYVFQRSRLLLGKDTKTSIVNILRAFLTNSCAACYSWVGAKKKNMFCELELVKIIKDSIRSQKGKELTSDYEISEVIKNWLRLATLRKDREREKQERARTE